MNFPATLTAEAANGLAPGFWGWTGGAECGIMPFANRNGKEKWYASLKGDAGECSPILVDNRLLVCTKTGIVSIHEVSTGRQLWEYETGEQIIAQPLVIGSHFYIQTARGTLLCFGEREE